MIIAQISDLHIGYAGPNKTGKNKARLATVAKTLNNLQHRPDLLIITGDLVEHGQHWAYEDLKTTIASCGLPKELPIYMAFGNHDRRGPFNDVYSDIKYADGFFQYTIEDWPVRIIVLDTLGETRHGGEFCEIRANWLDKELAKQPDKPTLIAMHHPPIKTGIDWLSSDPNSEWVQRLHAIISKYDNVKHMIAGHVHRSIFKTFAGTSLSVTQAIAPQTKLELAKIDPNVPDGRGLLVEARPGFCLHQWDGDSFTTHSAQSPCGKILLNYDEKFAYVIKHTMDLDH